jgi:prophage tail gpP-like protein
MAITVNCDYGDGSRPLDAVVDSLIITEADAINRGYAELNKAWKIIDTYTVAMPYPDDGYLLEVGSHVKLTCPEVGLVNQVLYIAGVSISGKNTGTTINLTLEKYEAFE